MNARIHQFTNSPIRAMGAAAIYVINAAISGGIAVAALSWWFASRRRAAADRLTQADAHARQTRQQAERDAETLRKEAQLEAREKAHELLAETERDARPRRHGAGRVES